MMPFASALPFVLALSLGLAPSTERPSSSAALDGSASAFARAQFHGPVDADQEVAPEPVDSNAHGHARVVIDEAAGTIQVQVVVANLSGPAIGAHLHLAPAGENGPVVVHLTESITQLNPHVVKITATLDATAVVGPLGTEPDRIAALLEELQDGNIYFNVHTDEYPAGEARGQL